jgi:glycosyltransferase involved in cell wall biosynthesis
VFVQVSTEPEPFGLVLVEALASGVPVVAGAEGGPGDVVTEPAYGRLVSAGDAAALAQAVLELLPPSTSSSGRRARPALRPSVDGEFGEVFADAVRRGRRSGRRGPWPARRRPK